ncbi:MAG: DUF2092 domain-containing protein [Burkholderiales bacterium]
MSTSKRYRRAIRLVAACALLSAAVLPQVSLAQPAGMDPQAEKLLKASLEYLAAQKRFSVHTRTTIEAVLKTGQKLQFDNTVTLSVQRPNKLRAERQGELVDQVFYYDGKSLTLYNPGQKYYATVDAPGSLEAMLDFERNKLDIIAPAGDLIYSNAYEILMQDATSGFVVGESEIEGARCDHLAFRNPDVDWQIWVQQGKQPLPRKFVITTKDVAGSPEFAIVMTKWDLAPKLSDRTFAFTPPKNAKKVDFLPLEKGTVPSK